jgi:hypothetical protein
MPLYRDNSAAVGPFVRPDPDAVQVLAVATASVITSTPFTSNLVRLATTTDCYYKLTKNPADTADNGDTLLPAGRIEYIQVYPGEYLAAIRNSADGRLSVTEVA